jgi:hypothetical protein
MEDVLEVYARPYDPKRPVVCLDEGGKELRSTPWGTLPAEPGTAARQDFEYQREGVANLFVAVEPLSGKRQVQITQRRTASDFADFLKFVLDEMYPDAEKVVLVTDNLNTHKIASFYERFAPIEARRLAQKIEWHYTPEHGSWLNIAEIELSVLHRQCLSGRKTAAELAREVPLWVQRRNQDVSKISWQFTSEDARVKLRRLYPVFTNAKSS